MKRREHMDYPDTPSGKRLAHSVAVDMVRLNRSLDALRALAYRDGVPPLFTDEDTPRVSPWADREYLLCELATGVARMDALRGRRTLPILPEDLRARVELLYHDICYHGNALEKNGYIASFEHPRTLAAQHYRLDGKLEDIEAFYERPEFQKPLPEINARGAAIASPQRAQSKA